MLPGVECWVQIATEDSDTFPDLFAPATIVELNGTKLSVTYLKHEGLPGEVEVEKVFQKNVPEEETGVSV